MGKNGMTGDGMLIFIKQLNRVGWLSKNELKRMQSNAIK
jgi:hypothetical protein